jgi:hypothetical protein
MVQYKELSKIKESLKYMAIKEGVKEVCFLLVLTLEKVSPFPTPAFWEPVSKKPVHVQRSHFVATKKKPTA